MSANVYIIAGPNGAGKTTFAREFLPRHAKCTNFVNADLIAAGVSPFTPDTAAFRAGRLMLEEVRRLARRGEDFGFEATLAGRAHLNLIRDFRKRGYTVHLFFLWVATVQLALSRVRNRVMAGGHDVSAPVVGRRFERSLRNFFRCYRPLAEDWILFDNSGETPEIIAFEKDGKLRIIQTERYRELLQRYGPGE